jgi:hypothetical protein
MENYLDDFPSNFCNYEVDSILKQAADLQDGAPDVLTGIMPLMPLIVMSPFQPTVSYTHVKCRMLLPCPKPVLRVD